MDSTTEFFQATKLRPTARLAYSLGSVDELMNYELMNTKSSLVQLLPGTFTERAKRRDMSKELHYFSSIVWVLHTLALWKAIVKIRVFNHAKVLQSFTSYDATIRMFHGFPLCTAIEMLHSLLHSFDTTKRIGPYSRRPLAGCNVQ